VAGGKQPEHLDQCSFDSGCETATLQGPPYPYLQEHTDWWVDKHRSLCYEALRELEEEQKINPDGPLKIMESCPVRSIREVKADGTDVFLGDVGFDRCGYDELDATADADLEKKRLVDANRARKKGDPCIVWTFGDYLAATHHRQGIMTAAVAALLKDWLIPRCNAHIVRAYTFGGNNGSVKVFQRNGFKLLGSLDDWKEVKGKRHGLNILEWRLEDR